MKRALNEAARRSSKSARKWATQPLERQGVVERLAQVAAAAGAAISISRRDAGVSVSGPAAALPRFLVAQAAVRWPRVAAPGTRVVARRPASDSVSRSYAARAAHRVVQCRMRRRHALPRRPSRRRAEAGIPATGRRAATRSRPPPGPPQRSRSSSEAIDAASGSMAAASPRWRRARGGESRFGPGQGVGRGRRRLHRAVEISLRALRRALDLRKHLVEVGRRQVHVRADRVQLAHGEFGGRGRGFDLRLRAAQSDLQQSLDGAVDGRAQGCDAALPLALRERRRSARAVGRLDRQAGGALRSLQAATRSRPRAG